MALHIRQLRCRVTVRSAGRKDLLHAVALPPKPSLEFALVKPEPREAVLAAPAETATEERGPADDRNLAPPPAAADPRAVADRVYELMRQEVALAKLRGAAYRRG